MANAIKEFLYGDKPLRIIDERGERWFVAKDVCEGLGVVWKGDETLAKIKDEWKVVRKLGTSFGDKDTYLVREPAIYKLAFRSNKAEAERFTDWLAGEVLPALMNTGHYSVAREERRVLRNDNRVRYAKMALVAAAMRLEDLGVDAGKIDMGAVVDFGRRLAAMGA